MIVRLLPSCDRRAFDHERIITMTGLHRVFRYVLGVKQWFSGTYEETALGEVDIHWQWTFCKENALIITTTDAWDIIDLGKRNLNKRYEVERVV